MIRRHSPWLLEGRGRSVIPYKFARIQCLPFRLPPYQPTHLKHKSLSTSRIHSTQLKQTPLSNSAKKTQLNSIKMLPTAARMTARRPFSVLARVRSIAHNPQIGHVQGYPASHQGAKADWGRQFRHLGSSAMLWVSDIWIKDKSRC